MEKSIDRRKMLSVGTTVATSLLIENLLIGCKVRSSGSDLRGDGDTKDSGAVAPAQLFPLLVAEPLLVVKRKIELAPESFPDIELANGTILKDRSPPKVALLNQLLILFQVQKNSFGVMDELLAANLDLLALPGFVYPGANPILPPVLLLSHKLVTGEALNDSNSKLYSLGAYAPEMPFMLGHFVLCDDDAERHDQEKKLMETLMRPVGVNLAKMIDGIAAAYASEKLSGPGATSEFDLVQDYARRIPLKVISEYLGIPLQTAREEAQLYQETSALFQNFLLNQRQESPILEAGRRAGYDLINRLVDLIEPKLTDKPQTNQTVIDRLILAWHADRSNLAFKPHEPLPTDPRGEVNPLYTRKNKGETYGVALRLASLVAGVLTPAAVAPEEGIARVFSVLLKPENETHLLAAMKIAKSGASDSDKKLQRYVDEAMRQQPQTEIIPRVLTKDTVIAGNNLHKGQMVFVGLYAAMHDKKMIKDPGSFNPERPEKESAACRLQFGFGRHTCLGKYLATAQMTSALKELLRKVPRSIKLSPGGRLLFNKDDTGPFAASMKVTIS